MFTEQLEELNRDLKRMIEMDEAILRQGKDGVSRIKILFKPKASYTDVARTKKVQGSVSLRVAFNTDGTVEILSVLKGLPNGLTESVVEAAKGVRFEPALLKGQPVRVVSMMQYIFDLF
jgi:TonB family protein